MKDRMAIFIAFNIGAVALSCAAVLDARTEFARYNSHSTAQSAHCLRACADCLPFCDLNRGGYFPPKP